MIEMADTNSTFGWMSVDFVDQRGLDRCCFQLMETERADLFAQRIASPSDLVEFEIVPVIRLGNVPPAGWLIAREQSSVSRSPRPRPAAYSHRTPSPLGRDGIASR